MTIVRCEYQIKLVEICTIYSNQTVVSENAKKDLELPAVDDNLQSPNFFISVVLSSSFEHLGHFQHGKDSL